MKLPTIFLLWAAFGLTSIAFSYRVNPNLSIPHYSGFPIERVNKAHIFRAVMGLYLGQTGFWVIGAIKPKLTLASLWSVVIFMWGLALGRILSVIVDGIPNTRLLVNLLLEIAYGLVAVVIIRKFNAPQTT